MEYGILTAEDEWGELYQIVGSVWSLDEARELAQNYLVHGPACDCVPPDRFIILRRGPEGFYTVRENFAL
jgi:hypothetical protein